ncbi:hypothetical protein C9374_006880 [Naegleria lovaniensis]|uniref:Kinesin motor domain-containing protein n=1 Tax=Naegleria lovaniensis TaxID=51637 RepID=A0AA88H4A3_NAELO|nr:uncharacterized protein C9374_006880 [Naegleria lovaniensis]KAG2393349.1 hypothetical protein C9374_006880 [Naegleria lovaniensis]
MSFSNLNVWLKKEETEGVAPPSCGAINDESLMRNGTTNNTVLIPSFLQEALPSSNRTETEPAIASSGTSTEEKAYSENNAESVSSTNPQIPAIEVPTNFNPMRVPSQMNEMIVNSLHSLDLDSQNSITLENEIYVPLQYAKQKVQQYIQLLEEMKTKHVGGKQYNETESNHVSQLESVVREFQTKYSTLNDQQIIVATKDDPVQTSNSEQESHCEKCNDILKDKIAMLITFNEEFLLLEKIRENEVDSLIKKIEFNKNQYKTNLERVEKEVNKLLQQLETKHREELAEVLKVVSERADNSSDLEKENHKLTILIKQLESEKLKLVDSHKKQENILNTQVKDLSQKMAIIETVVQEKTHLLEKNEKDVKLWKDRNDILEKEIERLSIAVKDSQEASLWKEKFEQATREIVHKERVEKDLMKNINILEEALRVKEDTTKEIEDKLHTVQHLLSKVEMESSKDKAELQTLKEERENMLNQHAPLEQEKQRLTLLLEQATKEIEDLKTHKHLELDRIKNIIKEQYEKIELLEQENHDLIIKRALDAPPDVELDKYKRLLSKYKSSSKKYKDALSELQDRYETLMKQHTALKDESNLITTALEESKMQQTQSMAHLEEKDHHIESLLQKIEILEDEISLCKNTDPERRHELFKELEKKLQQAVSEKMQAIKHNDDLKYEIVVAKQELDQEKRQVADMKKALQQHEQLSHKASILELVNAELKKNSEMDNRKVRLDYEAKIKAQAERYKQLKEEHDRSCAFNEKLFEQINATRTNIQSVASSVETVIQALSSTQKDENDLQKLAQQLQEQRGMCGQIEKRIVHIQTDQKSLGIAQMKQKLRFIARCKPSNGSASAGLVHIQGRNILSLGNKNYEFDSIRDDSQTEVFNEIRDAVRSSMEGDDICILATGPNTCGKTYTLYGTSKEKGLLPQTLDFIFNEADNSRTIYTTTVICEVSELGDDLQVTTKDFTVLKNASTMDLVLSSVEHEKKRDESHLIVTLMIDRVFKVTGERLSSKIVFVEISATKTLVDLLTIQHTSKPHSLITLLRSSRKAFVFTCICDERSMEKEISSVLDCTSEIRNQ